MQKFLLIIISFFFLSGFWTQPLEEKAAQENLPKSTHAFWNELAKCKISYNEKKEIFETDFSAEVKKLDGKEVTVSGFMQPLEENIKQKKFILSKRTPTCPFCLPGELNEFILIKTKNGIKFTNDLITLKGIFRLINDKEKAIFFEIDEAEIEPSP